MTQRSFFASKSTLVVVVVVVVVLVVLHVRAGSRGAAGLQISEICKYGYVIFAAKSLLASLSSLSLQAKTNLSLPTIHTTNVTQLQQGGE
jgi:hypothetical protein